MDSRVAEVVETVANELTADLSVAALSRRVNLSPSRLAHLFKQDMHLPLKAYVRSRRLIHATVLLTSTSLTVKEVAYEVGYM